MRSNVSLLAATSIIKTKQAYLPAEVAISRTSKPHNYNTYNKLSTPTQLVCNKQALLTLL